MRRDVRYGPGAIHLLPALVEEWAGRRVLLVCGGRSFEASGAAAMLPGLEQVAQVRRWSGFRSNTDAADLAEGLAIAAEFDPDVIVGIGGGSTMDMAKLLCAFPHIGDRDKLYDAIRVGDPIALRGPRLALAPTTSGSGSEATHFAVVYIGSAKFSVAGESLLPDAVILDPALTTSSSEHQRATSGIDAVAQAIESLWAVGATDDSRLYARRALRVLMPAIEDFVDAPAPGPARAMALGSYLAGRAIDISKTTAAHAMSYGLTKRYGVSHGHAVALTLGAFIEVHARAGSNDLQAGLTPQAHAEALSTVTAALGAGDPAEARLRFTELGRRLGLEMSLAGIGVTTAEQLEELAATVNTERLGNNPVRFDGGGLTVLLQTSM